MRSRPFIALRLPEVAHPGETFDVELSLDSASETPIDFVRVSLQSTQTLWSMGRGEILAVRERLLASEEVAGRGRLGEGVHRYRASFPLPDDIPPTHLGLVAELRCGVRALVSIPWWLDAEESGDIVVRPPIGPRPRSEPFTGASARGSGAFVEVSLPDRTFAPGDTLTGAIAFGGLLGGRASALEVALVGVERVHVAGQSASSEVHRLSFFRDLAGTHEGREVPFRIEVPGDLAPAFSAAQVSLEYALEAVLEHSDGRVVHRVPVVIGALAPRSGGDGKRPRVGVARWRAVWARAGQRAGLSVREAASGLGLRGVQAGCVVEVAPAEERSAPGLSATVHFAEPWGLDLHVRPRRALERIGVVTGDAPFDRHLRASGREDAQVLGALTPALRAALAAFPEVDLDDARARVRSAVGAFDESVLDVFLGQVEALARAVAEAGASLPPPAAMEGWLPAWRRFAEESDGALQVGPMRLTGTFEGAKFELRTRFERATPAGARLALQLDPPIGGASGPMKAAGEAIAAAILAQASRLGEVAEGAVGVKPGELAVTIVTPLADPAAVRDVLRSMLALAHELRGERRGGPYR
ncbi:hypothetical protein BE17_09245 [Sorangium cellulosum]|uniref:Arrestin-like N-terminal domain-containing protein n=1 Tax=Sorangium cellulosum TaxID=56 RepID=A0A150R7R1_SORCE|nr:hypothetical protein BE17_09245 [Sorangium cellulosum]